MAERRIQSEYYVEGYATTFGTPYVLDEYEGIKHLEQIDNRAFNGTDLADVIMQYDHEGKVLARVRNGTLIVEADEKGLFIAADLSKSVAAKELFEEIQNGLICEMSFGFKVEDGGDQYDHNTYTRTITKFRKVYDVSAVSIPANASTTISARTYAEGSAKAWAQELRERDRQKTIFRTKLITGGYKL